LKNAEEAEKLKKTIIEKIKGLKNGELAWALSSIPSH
jgi:hypothetical protein